MKAYAAPCLFWVLVLGLNKIYAWCKLTSISLLKRTLRKSFSNFDMFINSEVAGAGSDFSCSGTTGSSMLYKVLLSSRSATSFRLLGWEECEGRSYRCGTWIYIWLAFCLALYFETVVRAKSWENFALAHSVELLFPAISFLCISRKDRTSGRGGG